MDSPSFDFQSGSFGSYGDDLLMMGGDSGFDFGNVEWEQFDFDALPGLEAEVELKPEQLVDQCTPGLSPDTSLKDNNTSPESQVVSPADINSTAAASSRSQKSHARFSKQARSVLRSWFLAHRDHPYPTPDEKARLEGETGLQRHQVSLWLANARRRNKPRAQHSLPSFKSDDLLEIPEMQPLSQTSNQTISTAMLPPPLPAPVDTDEQAKLVFASLKPMERWTIDYRLSMEPTPIDNIKDAMARSPPRASGISETPAYNDAPAEYEPSNVLDFGTNASTSEFDAFWAQSMASYSTGLTGLASTSYLSDQTALSYQPSSASFFDTGSLHSFEDIKPRRRCKAKRAIKEQAGKFQCTFCANRTFKTKHDWQRHEKAQHLNIESWVCCAFGGTINTTQGGAICAFCSHPNPDSKHLETHHFSACQAKILSERTFYRKDHFVQHLRLVHECGMNSCMNIWKVEFPDIKSRCGFCNTQLTSWQERVDHLAAHFKAGSKMSEWKGGSGFEEHINAMIEYGPDWDPRRFDPEFLEASSSLGNSVSSLDYQGDAGGGLPGQSLDATLSGVPDADPSVTTPTGGGLHGLVSETGLGMGGMAGAQEGLYDIFECTTGTPCDD